MSKMQGQRTSRNRAKKASGKIRFTLRNDMMFHYVMSRSNEALKGLVCALKGLRQEEVHSVILLNPIDFNEYLEKEVILDVRVELNNAEILNIELQLTKDANWLNRSVYYLSRSYDNIKSGDSYGKIKPTTHVGILFEDLFPNHPEFYARYLLQNVENHHVYTTNFALNVLSLNRINMATEKDIRDGLVLWARAFRADTWEEMYELAKENDAFKEVIETMYAVNEDVHRRSLFEAHEKWLMVERARQERELENEERMRENEKKLRLSEELIKASEEQLKASEEQLKANEEQISKVTAERDALLEEVERLRRQLNEA